MTPQQFMQATGARTPVVCAGMAFVCDKAPLCAAVARAGGVGALAGSLLPPEVLRATIREVRAETDAPFHVNLLTVYPHHEHVTVLAEEKPAAVSFHWGLPAPGTLSVLKEAGVPVWVQVGSVGAAREAVAAGASLVVAQGEEAGGHNYAGPPLATLLPEVIAAVGPAVGVLAAGGIVTGADARAAMDAGAVGVWIGTRFVATPEANAHPEYKARILAAGAGETELTGVFGPEKPSFNPMRVIRNDLVEAYRGREADAPADRSAMDPVGTTLFGPQEAPVRPFDSFVPVPETTGGIGSYPLLCGAGVGRITALTPAAEVVREIAAAI